MSDLHLGARGVVQPAADGESQVVAEPKRKLIREGRPKHHGARLDVDDLIEVYARGGGEAADSERHEPGAGHVCPDVSPKDERGLDLIDRFPVSSGEKRVGAFDIVVHLAHRGATQPRLAGDREALRRRERRGRCGSSEQPSRTKAFQNQTRGEDGERQALHTQIVPFQTPGFIPTRCGI